MGQESSKNEGLFLSVLQQMLLGRGIRVPHKELKQFLAFIKKSSPWFPEEGTLSLEDWRRVGKDLRKFYSEQWPSEVPALAFSLWSQLRDLLGDKSEYECLVEETQSNPRKNKGYGALEEQVSRPLLEKYKWQNDDWLDPEEEAELDDEAAHCHNDDDGLLPTIPMATVPPLKLKDRQGGHRAPANAGFMAAVKEARREGDAGFLFPVISLDDEPEWEPLPLKMLKELAQAVQSTGASSPYTLQIVETVATMWLTPYDWQQTAQSVLKPGQYILWRTEFEDQARIYLQQALFKRSRGPKPTFSMLMGRDDWGDPRQQMKIPRESLQAISKIAISGKVSVLSGIRQRPEEPFEEFIARLEETVKRMMPESEGAEILLKQLAWENANTVCKDLLQPLKRTGTIEDFIRTCMDVSPAVIQGTAMAAALQEQTLPQFIKNKNAGKRQKGKCFKCGQTGHFERECPQDNEARWPPERKLNQEERSTLRNRKHRTYGNGEGIRLGGELKGY
ncbi:endogenous retrovirus group K member 5 Gag polyprotein-like [Erinaceus europaeus]|uniref:Endogenous retrovirus group K member 5 Gag polyprotein-like n=1 Tax=Erinaceus europaeus TaxID=9365 RepID=A0ABM3WNU3_ERIEU|nr:endogenous retrovirus group K member 5 Gag polyprotein-like [Erinaceus europaeus]